MSRRKFLRNTALLTGGLLSFNPSFSNQKNFKNRHQFNLKYAPHLGMFKHHAGKDPIDELQFMVDQGFTAFEDNNMKKRDLETQNRIASFMLKNNMEMGVFVAHTIHWKEPNLASGDKEKQIEVRVYYNS